MNTEPQIPAHPYSQTARVVVALVALTIALVVMKAPHALLIWGLDGLAAIITLFTAMCAGLGILRLLRVADDAPIIWRGALAMGLGIGWLSLLTLGCGLLGWIGSGHRYVVPGIFLVTGAVGWLFRSRDAGDRNAPPTARWVPWILLSIAPFAAMIVLSATLPPGVTWAEEGYGYDVLEYHLQTPKEYYESGRIEYLPHNVYASFPAGAEMLFLFGNQLMGETVEAWPVAKCINALVILVIVVAAGAIGSFTSKGCGVACALVAGTSGWLAYLGGIAYVEGGMLLMGILSVGCVLRAVDVANPRAALGWGFTGGLLAGFSCGFKYTAVVLIAIPIAVSIFVMFKDALAQRLKLATVFVVGCALSFSPWLIKNACMAGNPVFPLLGEWFDAYPDGWGEAESVHFAESHEPSADESSLGGRVRLIWAHIIADPAHRFGAVMLALAVIAWLKHRSRIDAGLSVMLVLQLLVWMFATHLYARFAVPMLIPLVLLAGRGAISRCQSLTGPFAIVLLSGATLNAFFAYQLYADHTEDGGQRFNLEGATKAFTEGLFESQSHVGYVNTQLPEDAYVLLVGEVRAFYFKRKCDYCVVFNRNPFAEAAADASTPGEILNWLRARGYTHVLVHYDEMRRLRNTYGFWESITPSLFEQLMVAGMSEVERFTIDEGTKTFAVLYAVPPVGSEGAASE